MANSYLRESAGFRLVLIGLLAFALLAPSFMIQGLIREREQRRDGAISEISDKWGNAQTVGGPILIVPFRREASDELGRTRTTIHHMHFLPEVLNIESSLASEIRYRGIFEVILYNARIHISGRFDPPTIEGFDIRDAEILWDDAVLGVGISHMKGIRGTTALQWNDRQLVVEPGIRSRDVLASGISAKIPGNSAREGSNAFSLDLNLNGSETLSFIPLGKETHVKVSSSWTNPSFMGEFLPESREINDSGFSAEWRVLHLNRNFPQKWIGAEHAIQDSSFGVKLLMAVDEYQKTMRTAKYAIMFIVLTFVAFFLIEIRSTRVLHPINYLLIGLALIVFYTLLLSISEHMVFRYAYLIASAGIVLMIVVYARSLLSSNSLSALIAGILIVLYGFLYVILQLQDYALLLGSIGLFLVLALVMYLTRRIDWFAVWKTNASKGAEQKQD